MSLSPSELPLAGVASPPDSPMLSAAVAPRSLRAPAGRLPLLVLGIVFCAWTLLHGDVWLADHVYAWEGHTWVLRHARVTQQLIHLFGRDLSAMAWLAVLAAWLVATGRTNLAPLRKPLLYLLAATALSTLLVAWIKSWSNMDCPWDLARYGGTRPYIGLFALRPAGLERGVCFPAGHAGAGYTWLALYFFLVVVKPQLRWLGLGIGVAAGLLFGISQQLRGAHFLSHDIAAAAICWACAMALHAAFWPARAVRAEETGSATTGSRAGVPVE
ncbi:phosphatase PAP2 family protein [Agrilutibacter niabensis]|uniref:phosphatase PAP2 family protein n=1 Tax=Agrilutibacter niabensis TaxID=380628 RepID=UPI0036DBF38F